MAGRKIKVKTGITQGFVENIIARDITTMASIFDLIDNSIDAAKEQMQLRQKGKHIELDRYNMPSNYNNYEVMIEINEEHFSISDNCLGIEEEILSDRALLVGVPSDHDYGLGKYGIGLKRALFKFGTAYHLMTDTGVSAFHMDFTNKELSSVNQVDAEEIKTTGSPFTLFRVSNLNEAVKEEFTSQKWLAKLERELASRYGIFIDKGFKIKLAANGNDFTLVKTRWPKFHENFPLVPSDEKHTRYRDVDIYIEYGLHTEFILKAEQGVNDHLFIDGNPFGWNVICNDRVIEIAVGEGEDYGWSKAWHNEYNGFVGYIRFNSKSVESLPWDSTKTKIITEDLIFLNLKDTLAGMAKKFRRIKKAALASLKGSTNIEPSSILKPNDSEKNNTPSGTSSLIEQINADKSATESIEGKTPQNNSRKKRGINNPDKRPYITDGKYRIPLNDKNLKRVYNELTTLIVEEKTMAVALLIRVFLENLFKAYYEHRLGHSPSPKLQTHQVIERIISNIKSDENVTLALDEKKALSALNSIASNPHGPLSPKMLGANAHLASYPIGKNLKIEWDNIDAIIAYFAEDMHNNS